MRLFIRRRMRNLMIALSLLPFALLAGCDSARQAERSEAEEGPVTGVDRSNAGKPMPDAQLLDSADEEATLAQASGEGPVLVNLWASWCAPCVKELPTLQALSKREGAPRVIAVAQEIGERPSIDAFLQSHGIDELESWRDPKMALSGALGVQVMPTTVYYDSSGKEVWRYVGDLDWSGEEASRLLSEAGAGKG